jgi:hypothetical protein
MKLRYFVLELVLDASFDERVGGENRFRHRTRSEFIRFKSSDRRRAERKAALRLQKFCKEHVRGDLVSTRLYKEQKWK